MTNYILGKVKRKQNPLRIIATETEVYNTDTLVLTGIEYNPAILIEDEELYKISNFSTSGYSLDFLTKDFDSVNYDQITTTELKNLSYICSIQDNLYFFQIINSSFFISKKWFKIDEPVLETNKPIVTINPTADTVYDKTNDTLYFKKLSIANRIFKGMDQLYREATDKETQDFLGSDFLLVQESFTREKVSIPNRKKIALVLETMSKFSVGEKQAIYDYINQYGHVAYNEGKFSINTDDDLKFVLWGIEQRFYTTPVGGERRVANSVITI